jgi:uncharacterized membrane protein
LSILGVEQLKKMIIIAAVLMVAVVANFVFEVYKEAKQIEENHPERTKSFKMVEEEQGEVPCYENGELCEEEAE